MKSKDVKVKMSICPECGSAIRVAVEHTMTAKIKDEFTEARIMKAEGVKAGVSDLILLVPNKEYSFLCIEMKTEKGVLSTNQKKFKKGIEKQGFGKYVICRSFDDFKNEIETHLTSTIWGKKVS